MTNAGLAVLIVASTAGLAYLVIAQPGKLECGAELNVLHLWVYFEGLLILLVIIIYVELLIAYFLKTSKDKKLGFLLDKKRSIRNLAYKVGAAFLILGAISAYEAMHYSELYVCLSKEQEMELSILALVLKWLQNLTLVVAYYCIFSTFAYAPRSRSEELQQDLIRMDSHVNRHKSFSFKNDDNLSLVL